MFKFRFGGQGGSSPAQPPSIDSLRQRARHRLLGASLLVLAGVVGFPLLFESQPRPVPANFAIEIPARKKPQVPTAASEAVSSADGRVDGLDEKEELVTPAPVARASASVPAASVQAVRASQSEPLQPIAKPWEKKPVSADNPAAVKPEKAQPAAVKPLPDARPAPEKKAADNKTPEHKVPESKAVAKAPDEAARALALLEGKSSTQPAKSASDDKPADKGRIIVQVGAFVDPALAQEARMKLERAGLTTYTQVGNTPDGPRTRVRLGPFSNRAEAEKAAAKARTQGLSAAILTL